MAIFIIDQFSLNTDLPLDIRYVPTTGRFDPDISVYKYPGMQVFDTNTESIWYADNSLNWVEVGSGSDASLNAVYTLINDLSTYITNNVDVSINNLYQITNQLDASIERIDVSLNDYGELLAIHDASIGDLYLQINQIESSIGDIIAYQAIQDASILANEADILQIESSIGDINAYQAIQDASILANEASIGDINNEISQLDASIVNINAYQAIQDASIAYNDSSIQQLFGEIGSNDASIDELYQQQAIQDASILANEQNITIIDGSITYLTNITNIHDVSIGDLYDYNAIQDASIAALESSLGDYVRKDGDTMTGALVIDASLQVNNTAGFLGNVDIAGNLVVDGSAIFAHTTVLDVSTGFINLNTGLTGPPPTWLQSGIIVERGDASSYAIVYDETLQTFRVGIVNGPDASGVFDDSETQAVATREDSPTVDGIAVWNDTEKRYDTFGNLTYDDTNGLSLDTSLNLGAFSPASTSMLVVQPDGYVSIQEIPNYDASLNELYTDVSNLESSVGDLDTLTQNLESSVGTLDGLIQTNITDISNLESSVGTLDGLIQTNITDISNIESSLGTLDGLIQTNITDISNLESSVGDLDTLTQIHDASIGTLDSSVTDLYSQLAAQDTSVKGAINIGDGSAGVYAGITNDGSLQFREFVGVGAATITENGSLIEVGIDASFGGEVNTASNIGTGEGLSVTKQGEDLPFKSIDTNDPSTVIITADNSTLYIDVSIDSISDASLVGLTDTSLNEAEFVDHTNMEWDEAAEKWVETQNLWWDTSLATTTNDLGGIPQGTNLEGDTLKEILYKILYEYQPPTLSVTTDPVNGTFEKGIVSTQFSSIDIDWTTTNANYPLALLNNLYISKTGSGTIFDTSLGLVASDTSTYTDATGITNWGGTNRTITYNVTVDDNTTESQPAVGSSRSFTFYYRQYWGMVAGNTNANQVDSDMIKGLVSSRLAGESTLNANFDNSTGGFVKYLFAYPDTVASPDNFGTLSQIVDQNDFDITDSWDTDNEDVSVGVNNVRYRFYLAKNKVDTEDFDISFIF